MKLNLSPELQLPIDAVTKRLAWVGTVGSGKTYGASKACELMLEAGAQCIVLDPVGVWWALRLGADGKAKGISIPVFGGMHGDIPLEPASGGLVADLIVDKGISVVLDVSQFEYDTDKARFASDFANRFFFRKKQKPSAVHIFLEECQEFVPQNPQKGEEKMLHAFNRMWKIGRNFGIGGSLISQRPQEVNKKALNLTQCLFAFQTMGTHERNAIEAWIEDKALDLDIAADLPKLKVGQPHAWAPAWLGISETISIHKKKTFNASATPEVGATAEVKQLAPIDLEKLSKEMAATVERAKQNDPTELKKKLRDAEAKILKLESAKPVPQAKPTKEQIEKEAQRLAKPYQDAMHLAQTTVASAKTYLRKIADELDAMRWPDKTITLERPQYTEPQYPIGEVAHRKPRIDAENKVKSAVIQAAEGEDEAQMQRIIDTVAMLEQRGLTPNTERIARWLAIHPRGGRYTSALASLRAKGLLDKCQLTQMGYNYAGEFKTGVDAAREALKEGQQQRIFDALRENTHHMTTEELAEKLGIHPRGGRYTSAIAWLRTMGILPERGKLYLTKETFQ